MYKVSDKGKMFDKNKVRAPSLLSISEKGKTSIGPSEQAIWNKQEQSKLGPEVTHKRPKGSYTLRPFEEYSETLPASRNMILSYR